LILYNSALTVGWSVVLYLIVDHLFKNDFNPTGSYDRVELILKISQTAAVLEVLHVLLGLVKSDLFVTIVQVASRIVILWLVAHGIVEVRDHWSFSTMVISWSITEIIRYSFYVCGLFESKPYLLLWCRYTFFFILYPTGAGSEFILAYMALPFVKEINVYFYYGLVGIMTLYIPLFPVQYFHMITQRKKNLGGGKKKQQ
jgi:very-long-chain (3R)-3-hydroxyacyl-CoA dehydratase